ncbi:hypothetical protein SAMD00019534_016010, partial [Acytostelium subglobosum LB1]|uniref:hypothetical protein n=1 Tax=Acytostelium subglobosum LB1 TaxID=1410327 RepID=UPI000644D602
CCNNSSLAQPDTRHPGHQMPLRRNSEVQVEGTNTTVQLRDLFNAGRWKKPFTFKHFLFALYLPFGLALWPVRLMFNVLVFSFLLVIPKRLRFLTPPLIALSMGVITRVRGRHNLPSRNNPNAGRIIVCNHLSDFDPYPIYMMLDYFHVLVAAHIANVPIIGNVYRKMDAIYVDQANRDKARLDVMEALSKTNIPLLIYPEGGLTSGKTGLMMFQKFVFGLGHGVTPISMRLTSPWPINVDYLGSNWFKNFFWWIMVPFHIFELNVLPTEFIKDGETDMDFAKRVQSIIAKDLRIEATSHPYAQKRELVKEMQNAKQAKR